MTTQTYPRTFHVLASGLTVTLGDWEANVLYRGQTFSVSEEQYNYSKDKRGASWLDLTPEEQESRWGLVRFAEGETPEGIEVGDDDIDGLMYRKWMADVKNAERISQPAERAAEFKRIRRKYPRQYGSTQRTISEG